MTIVNLNVAGTNVTAATWTATTEAIDYTAILAAISTTLSTISATMSSINAQLAAINTQLTSIKNSQITLASPVITRVHFVASAGQTSFSVGYTVGFITVWRSGIRLVSGADYTASNGSSVNLFTPASADEEVDVYVLTPNLYQNIGPDDALTRAILKQNLSATGQFETIRQEILNPTPFP